MIRCLKTRTRRKRVFIPSPPRCSSPGEEEESGAKGDKPESTMIQSLTISEAQDGDEMEQYEIVVS